MALDVGMVEDDGFEPPNSKRADLQSAVFSHFTNPPHDYRLPKAEKNGGSGRNRTADTRIFSPLLYRLSYRAYYSFIKMAELTGFEPAVSCVTGRHVRPLHHSSRVLKWWRLTGSNRRPSACKADALPAELSLHTGILKKRSKMVAAKGIEPPTSRV